MASIHYRRAGSYHFLCLFFSLFSFPCAAPLIRSCSLSVLLSFLLSHSLFAYPSFLAQYILGTCTGLRQKESWWEQEHYTFLCARTTIMARLPLLLAFLFVIACMPFATAATSSGDRDDLKVEIRNEVLSELRQLLAKSAAPPQSGPSPARTASQPVVLNAAGERKRSVSDSGPMQRRRRFLSGKSRWLAIRF